MTEAEQSIINSEHYKEVFELKPPRFPDALMQALNTNLPDYYAWRSIQPALAYVLEGYEPEPTSHSTTPSKGRKRVQHLMHPETPSRYNRRILSQMFNDGRKLYKSAKSGKMTESDVSKALLKNKTLLQEMPIGSQEVYRKIFLKVYLGGFFKPLQTGF